MSFYLYYFSNIFNHGLIKEYPLTSDFWLHNGNARSSIWMGRFLKLVCFGKSTRDVMHTSNSSSIPPYSCTLSGNKHEPTLSQQQQGNLPYGMFWEIFPIFTLVSRETEGIMNFDPSQKC